MTVSSFLRYFYRTASAREIKGNRCIGGVYRINYRTMGMGVSGVVKDWGYVFPIETIERSSARESILVRRGLLVVAIELRRSKWD
jgi:hypothetical protein